MKFTAVTGPDEPDQLAKVRDAALKDRGTTMRWGPAAIAAGALGGSIITNWGQPILQSVNSGFRWVQWAATATQTDPRAAAAGLAVARPAGHIEAGQR